MYNDVDIVVDRTVTIPHCYKSMYVREKRYMYVCMCIYVYMYVSTYTHIYMYTLF